MDICLRSQAKVYVNSHGGKNLYDKTEFDPEKIALAFLNPQLNSYQQTRKQFLPGLSILDILMNCSLDQIQSMLKEYVFE